MTQLVSDIRILDNLLALNLNVSLWSARRKMSQEDLGGAELPPEDLASLGSKRIADPENLKGSSSFDVEFMKPLRPESGPQSGRPW